MKIDVSEMKSIVYSFIAKSVVHLKWIDRLNSLGAGIGVVAILTSGIMIAFEVFMRYIMDSPTTWAMEISTYLVMAGVLLSIGYALKENAHIKVDWITNQFSKKAQICIEISNYLFSSIFIAYLIWEGTKLAIDSYVVGETTASVLRLPQFMLLSLVPLGASMMLLQIVPNVAKLFIDLQQSGTKKIDKEILKGIGFSSIVVILLLLGILLIKDATMISASILFVVLLFSGIPVAIALGLFGMLGFMFYFESFAIMSQLPLVTYATLNSDVMAAVPLYILCGVILVNGQISARLFTFMNVWVRHLTGGLAIASIGFCALFAAISGSSVATAATVSIIAIPEMLKRGYDRKFIFGLLGAGGTLGILIPPSLPMMVYGAMTDESIAQLFMAGVIPGILLCGMFIAYILLLSKFGSSKLPPGDEKASLKEKMIATGKATGALTVPIIILGGIYLGIFTPTEAGGVAMTYSLILCAFIYKSLNLASFKDAMLQAIKTSAMIMFLVVGANLTGQITAMLQIPQSILETVLAYNLPSWLLILLINVFLIILGMPLEAISILVITVPILHPIMIELGFNPLWFAIIMVINMEMALISPPEGLNLFVIQSIGKATTAEVSKGVIPFLLILGLFLLIVSVFPGLATWLPSKLM